MPTRPEETQLLLRREVGTLRRRETRRRFDPMLYVGRLAGARDSLVVRAADHPVLDPALRTDAVTALLERTGPDLTTSWLVRPGCPDPHDEDLAWFSAAARAFAVHQRPLDGFFVVTRYGWRDVRSGARRDWKRLRL